MRTLIGVLIVILVLLNFLGRGLRLRARRATARFLIRINGVDADAGASLLPTLAGGIAMSRLRQALDSDVAFTVGVIVVGPIPMALVMAMLFLS